MAGLFGEGGGGGIGRILPVIGPLIDIFSGGLKKTPQTPYERAIDAVFNTAPIRSGVRLGGPPRVFGPVSSSGGIPSSSVYAAQQGGAPQPRVRDPITDFLDAAIRGISRGLELRDLLLQIMSLFGGGDGGGRSRAFTTTRTEVIDMPYLTMPGAGVFGTTGDVIGGFGSLAEGIGSILAAVRGRSAMPGGAGSFLPSAGRIDQALGGQGDFGNVVSGSASCPSLFRSGATTRATPLRRIIQQNPVTGNLAVWEYAGHPILMSRDAQVAKRFARITGRPRPRSIRRRARRRFR